ncbi:MAG TPA: bifunctional hydroxymethylpyrimidine kinase/phosphomethylpyrimidine kinase [Bryobacteraceae bacterium]|nr:bifunctional hydroxymethylpyrimidine kinase/phosphomethylpyrimidine kinase [Bryobacteraceae bacterium]
MIPVALTIAGSDPSGGAGIQADLKTFHQFGVYGQAVITLLTVQNSVRVSRVECVPAGLVTDQIRAVFEDIPPGAAKSGALGNAAIIEAVAALAAAFHFPLVVDPVMISKHGAPLVDAAAREAIARCLVPHAFLVTPNLEEAAALTGTAVNDKSAMLEAGRRLCGMGAKAALVKGGHLDGPAADILYTEGRFYRFAAPRVATRHTHGTGCTYSAAITASLAAGSDLVSSVERAKQFMNDAIATAPGLGAGSGPVNHHARVR